MSNIPSESELPSVKATKQDLALLQQFLQGECTENQLPHARRVLRQLEDEEGLELVLNELWEQDPEVFEAPDVQLYQRIAQSLALAPPAAPPPAPARALPWRRHPAAARIAFGAVAGLCLVAAGAFWVGRSQRPPPPAPAERAWLTVTTTAGERKTVWLPDSSRVVLNAASQLRYPAAFAAGHREVELTGEGFFRIMPDQGRPFAVATRLLTATALGTAFNVSARPNEAWAEVAVLTGRVAVAGQGQPGAAALVLRAHEAARCTPAAAAPGRVAFPDAGVLAWQAGEVVFHDTNFAEVVARLERHYGVAIRVTGGPVTRKRYTGRFRHERLANVLDSLRHPLGFDYTIADKQVIIHFN